MTRGSKEQNPSKETGGARNQPPFIDFESEIKELLLSNFNLETLFDKKYAASYDVRSDDSEMKIEKDVLVHIPESEEILDFIRTPTTNITQLQQRQILIESLLEIEELDSLVNLKTASYKINEGISSLFYPVSINEYQIEPALYAYRNGYTRETKRIVFEGISLVEQGKQAISNLVSLLSKSKNPFILEIKNEYKRLSESLECLTKDFFLKEEYGVVDHESTRLSKNSKKIVTQSGVFFEFAKLAKKDKYGSAQFDSSQSRYYEQGWNFSRKKESKKEKQVLNDSPGDHQVTVYAGGNMSGKSFGLKKELFIQSLAQSFGYGTWEGKANFPKMHNSFHYLDRASTKHLNNLSAFGSETNDWKDLTSTLGKNAFVCVDEGWSTTSAEGQYRLLHGVVSYLSLKGAKVFLTSHNNDFLNSCIKQPNTGIYHFKVEIDPETLIPTYSYKLNSGIDKSYALAVARKLGLPEEIITIMEEYLNGEQITIGDIKEPRYREPIVYTQKERVEKKQKKYGNLFAHPDNKDPILTLLSKDRDFRGIFFGSLIQGRYRNNISFCGWNPRNASSREYNINELVFNGPVLSSQEALERITTFEELAKNNQFQEMVEVEEKLLFLIKFLPHLHHELLLRFNLELNPFDNDERVDVEDYNLFVKLALSYLRLNFKLMGEDFPLMDRLKRIEAKQQLVSVVEEVINNRSIEEIIRLLTEEQKAIVTDQEIIFLFNKVAKNDEPNPEKWDGIITLERITEYCRWIDKNDWQKCFHDQDFRKLLSKIRNSCSDASLAQLVKKLRDTKRSFIAISQKHSDAVTAADIEKLLNQVSELEKEEMTREAFIQLREQKRNLRIQLIFLRDTQMHLKLTPSEFDTDNTNKITPQMLINDMLIETKACIEDLKTLPPLKIFDYDLSSISEEIRFLVEHRKEQFKNHDLEYNNHWYKNLTFNILLEFLVDKRNYPRELIAALRKNDSIHTHQIANMVEDGMEECVRFGGVSIGHDEFLYQEYSDIEMKQENWELMKEEIGKIFGEDYLQQISRDLLNGNSTSFDSLIEELSLGSGPHMLKIFSGVYSNTVEKVDRALSKLEHEKNKLSIEKIIKEATAIAKDCGMDSKEILESLERGDLRELRKEINTQYSGAVLDIIKFSHRRSKQALLHNAIERAMSLFLIGHIIKSENMSPVTYNQTGEIELPGARNLFKPKDGQTRNDISFTGDEHVKLLGSPNMSGKTFWMKAAVAALLWTTATGHSPSEGESTMPLLDLLLYLDRVTSRSDRHLSSNGEEIKRVITWLKKIKAGKVGISIIDELGSSTSPEEQAAIYVAMVITMIERGQYAVFASHSHEATDFLEKNYGEHLDAAHFTSDHSLFPGREDSKAVDVAEDLGLNKEIIEFARMAS